MAGQTIANSPPLDASRRRHLHISTCRRRRRRCRARGHSTRRFGSVTARRQRRAATKTACVEWVTFLTASRMSFFVSCCLACRDKRKFGLLEGARFDGDGEEETAAHPFLLGRQHLPPPPSKITRPHLVTRRCRRRPAAAVGTICDYKEAALREWTSRTLVGTAADAAAAAGRRCWTAGECRRRRQVSRLGHGRSAPKIGALAASRCASRFSPG